MIFDGEHSVIQAIKKKKRLVEAGESHQHIRPLCIQCGGLMRGAYGLGAAIALEEQGHTNSFSSLVGLSSGAPIVAHFAAGTVQRGRHVLIEDCTNPGFVNPWRFWNQVDTKYLMELLRSDEEKKIDLDKVLANPAKVYIGVTEYQTAKPVLLSPKNEDLFFKAMHASINMQNVSPYKIVIDGVHYADGGFSAPHMISEAITTISPTHVLIITNNDRSFKPLSLIERTLNRTLFRLRLNGALAQAINTRREARDQAIAETYISGIPTAVVWGDGSVNGMERNAKKIEAAVEASRTWWHGLFALEK